MQILISHFLLVLFVLSDSSVGKDIRIQGLKEQLGVLGCGIIVGKEKEWRVERCLGIPFAATS